MDVERAITVNHGQISRIERGEFSTKSTNVQSLCTFFKIKDDFLASARSQHNSLQKRLEKLLLTSPQYAMLFATVLDALEVRAPAAEIDSLR